MFAKTVFTKTMILKFLAAAAAILALGGCECAAPGSTCAPGSRPAPDGKVEAASQVKGDVVYNLGQGVMANSSSVLLAGGFTRSRQTRLAGGIAGCCPNPVPQAYWDAVRNNQPLAIYATPNSSGVLVPATPAIRAIAPAGGGDTVTWEAAVTALPGYVDGESCPVYPESRIICQPGENLSDCYTLPADGTEAIETIVPSAGRGVDVTPTPPERAVDAEREEALTPPPAVAARTTEAAEIAEMVDVVESVQAIEPVAPAAPAPIAVPEPIAAPTAAVTAETVKAEVAAAFDPTEPVARASVTDIMPPVPAVEDFDAAIDAILSRDGEVADGQGLPEVQLPPQLR